jgi:periplasmic protein TonB
MFDAWEHQSDAARVKRFTGATAAAVVVMSAILAGLLVMASRPAEAARAKKVDVSFRPPPPPPEPAKIERPPPPKPKPAPKVADAPAPAPAPAPMVAPKEIPKEAVPEVDAAHAVAAKDVAVGGTGDGTRGGSSDGDESAAPVVANAGRRGPVNLPEDADPPEPDENNEQPEYPEAARSMGHEARVVLKIVVEANGHVGRIDVLKGEEPFTSVAVSTVKTWKYEPARLDGAPISVFKIVDLKFRLRSE